MQFGEDHALHARYRVGMLGGGSSHGIGPGRVIKKRDSSSTCTMLEAPEENRLETGDGGGRQVLAKRAMA